MLSKFKYYSISTLFLFLTIIYTDNSWSAGTTGFHFLKMNMGGRAQGMGNAFTGISSDVNSLYYNPAGLAFAYYPSITFYHARWIEDISIENISFHLPTSEKFSLAGGFSYLHLPAIEGYDVDPSGNPISTGSFQVYDFIAQVGMSYQLSWDLSVGITSKFLQERIDDVTANGVAFDIGLLYKLPVDYLSWGLAIQNLGPKISYQEYQESLPLTYRTGLAYQLPNYDVTFTLDGVKTTDEDFGVYPGMEVNFLEMLSLRGGYQFDRDEGVGYNVGLGVQVFNRYQLNYVFSPLGILGNTHRAEFTVKLGSIFDTKGESHSNNVISKHNFMDQQNSSTVQNQASSNFVPVPTNLKATQEGNAISLTWSPLANSDAQYNLHVLIPGKTGIVRINQVPIKNTRYTFKPKVNDLKIQFYISAVINGRESNLSQPISFQFKR